MSEEKHEEPIAATPEQLEAQNKLLGEAWAFLLHHQLGKIGGCFSRLEALPEGGFGRVDYNIRITMDATTPAERLRRESESKLIRSVCSKCCLTFSERNITCPDCQEPVLPLSVAIFDDHFEPIPKKP